MNPQRLLNLTPVTVGRFGIDRRSAGADGNSAAGLELATARARRSGFTHVEAHDVRTGERFYMAVAR